MEAELFIHFISSGPGRAAQLCLPNACAADSLPLGRSTLDQGLLPFPSHLISMECLGVGVLAGFILFNLHLIGRRVVLSPDPTTLPPSRAATALLPLPSCASSRPSKALGATWGLAGAPWPPEQVLGASFGGHLCQRGSCRWPREGGAALRSSRGAKGTGGRSWPGMGVLLWGQRHPQSRSRCRAALPSARGGNGSACSATPTCVCSQGWREGRGGGDTMQVTG